MVSRLVTRAALLNFLIASFAVADTAKLPPGYIIAPNSFSPSHRFAFSAPQEDVYTLGNPANEHNQLIDQSSGKVVATLVGEPGCIQEWRGGILNPWWSLDESTVAWGTVNRSFQGAFVVLKMKNGQLLWQVDVLKVCTVEVQQRIKTFQASIKGAVPWDPNNFKVALDTEPNYFSGQTTAPLSLPLKVRIRTYVQPDAQIEATLTATVQEDGTVKYDEFRVVQD